MIDVYICGDNEKQRNYLKSQIENFITFEQLDMQITTVTDKASVILSTAREASNCGLYFLDIDLNTPETNGFLLAQNIRKVEPRCFIVFVTSHIELSYYTYQYKVEALDFIVKDNLDTMKNKIHECILNAYEKHTCTSPHNASIFTATMPDDRQISVPYVEIISFETATVTHKIILHGKNRMLEFLSDNFNERIEQKIFHCEIVVDAEKVKREESAYKKIPVITNFTDEDGNDRMKETVQANYRRIKEEVKQIVQEELERIKNDPVLCKLLPDNETV